MVSRFIYVPTKLIFAKFLVALKTKFNSGSHERSKNVSFDLMFQYIVSISLNYESSHKTFITTYYISSTAKGFTRYIFKYIELLTSMNTEDNFGLSAVQFIIINFAASNSYLQ